MSFKLLDDFVEQYVDKQVPWGFGINGNNSIGEITFIRTYSRNKPDGTKERWWEVCERVINGMYSIQKDHVKQNKLPWNDRKAQASAQEAFDRMFNLKWTPSGRGLWTGGTELIHDRGLIAANYNCAFVSTSDMQRNDPGAIFSWVMDALMLGVGVGIDSAANDKHIVVQEPTGESIVYEIPDSREGWGESVRLLINSWLVHGKHPVLFDYSLIRPAGQPIKTFGGVASGSGILQELHQSINNVCKARIGESIDALFINDIANLIGTCVVSGNIRRSAEIFLGSVNDPIMYDLKNPVVYPERNSYNPANPGWSWLSNNTVVVKDNDKVDYEKLANHIKLNGEPGILWLSTQQQYGRMADPPNNKDWRVQGTNPCLVGNTWIQTSEGPQQIVDLIGKQTTVMVNGVGHKTTSAGFFHTGTKQVYELTTQYGHTVKLTGDHKVQTVNGWKTAESLIEGDKILLNNHVDLSWGRTDNYGDGYLIGLFVGDGNFSKSGKVATRSRNDVQIGDPTYTAHIKVWDYSGDDKDIADYAYKYASQHKYRSDWNGWSAVKNRPYQQMVVTPVTKQYKIYPDHKHDIQHLEYQSSEFYKGFLRGLFDADGHVEGYNNDKGLHVVLGQSNYELLQSVQRMLLRLGINSRIYASKPAGKSLLPDGKGGMKHYPTKASWRLFISSNNVDRFAEKIGFYHLSKSLKLQQGLEIRRPYSQPFISKFKSLTPVGIEEVYDATVPAISSFDANGMVVHNCSEISLESKELCNLVELHLNKAESKEDFIRTIKFAFLYAKTITLQPTHWPETNAVIQRNRRIGTSVTGTADFYDNNGIDTLKDWLDTGYKQVGDWDKLYSEWLGIRESIKLTTSKPSGTVSLLSGNSPGVHWSPGSKYYLRAIRFAENDPMVQVLKSAGYKIEQDIVSKNTLVIYFPVESNAKRSERDVSVFEKAHLASMVQRYWADNSVSVTLSFDKQTESDHVVNVLKMFDKQLKTASFLPMGNDVYPQQPYTSITKQEYEEYARKIKVIDWTGIYENYDDAVGESYCTTDSCML